MAKKLSGRRTKPSKSDRSFSIVEVAMIESSSSRAGVAKGASLPGEISLSLRYTIQADPQDLSLILFLVPIEVSASYGADEPPALTMSAKICVVLKFDDPVPKNLGGAATRKQCRDFALFTAWPYWRQFVQQTSLQMGLPIMRIPIQIPTGILADLSANEARDN